MRKFGLFLLFLIIILGGVIFFWNDILYFYKNLSLPKIEEKAGNLITQEIEKQVSTPPPLRAEKENPQSFLTRSGVVQCTNAQRAKYGLPPLKENTKLDASAEIKAQDMLKNQYFAHESPTGARVDDLVASVGYDFIAIGENLALGNFKDDETLVQAWMDSPGHRANILNNKYQEIGVAVIKGMFEREPTWLAVQHFGMPLSSCPQPDETLKVGIESNNQKIQTIQANLESLKIEIQGIRPRGRVLYNQKIEQYNNLISQYNNLIAETGVLINKYNAQVKTSNDCVNSK
jgi:uncharacterized protein YkwD